MTSSAHSATSTRLKMLLAWILVLAALVGVVAWIGLDKLLAPWRVISTPALGAALLLMVLSYVLRALRIQRYFIHELRGQFWPTLKLSTWHILLNNFLPMRTGEVSFPILMQRYFTLPASRTVPVLLWFRLLDLQAIVLLGLVAAIWGMGLPDTWVILVVLLVPAPVFVYLARHRVRGIIAARPAGKWRDHLLNSVDSLPQSTAHFLATLGWTWANWLVKLLTLAWVLAHLAPLSLAAALAGAIGGDLTTVLPIHAPGGFGTFEAGIMVALQPFGLDATSSLAAAVNLHLFVLGSSLLAALVVLLIKVPGKTKGTAEPEHGDGLY